MATLFTAFQEHLMQHLLPRPLRRGLNLIRRVPYLSILFGEPPVEQAVTRFYSRYIAKEDVVVEVGARIGDGTRILARLARHVYALEAARKSFLLLRIFTKGCKNVDAYNIGLSDHVGYAKLQTDRGFSGVASLKKLAGVSYIAEETVRVAKLDCLRFSPPPTSLVLDCEGSEIEVLKGAEKSLWAMKTVLVETHAIANGSTTLEGVVSELKKFSFQPRVVSAGNESWVLARKTPEASLGKLDVATFVNNGVNSHKTS